MVADVGDEDVEVGVEVDVADGKAHPGTDLIDAGGVGDFGEPNAGGVGVVAHYLEPVAVGGEPQVGVAVVVVVEEERRVGL